MSDKTPKQVATDAATFLLHSYSMGDRDQRPWVAQAIVQAVTVALTTGEWANDVKYPTSNPDPIGAAIEAERLRILGNEDAPTWRDFTIEADDEEPMAYCRNDDTCEGFISSKPGQSLTLGEAVDWAKEHAAAHDHDRDIEERAAREDDLRAGLGSAYYNLPYPIADKAPWNGQPTTAPFSEHN